MTQWEASSGVIILQCKQHYAVSEVKGKKSHTKQTKVIKTGRLTQGRLDKRKKIWQLKRLWHRWWYKK